MATAFTERERERIVQSLLDAALQTASTVGMRHVSVEELSRAAGISKGAFYHFYKSKEHLFLHMLENLHGEMYGSAARVFAEHCAMPIRSRAVLAVYEVILVAQRHNAFTFLKRDVPLLLRRLPPEAIARQYISDEERLRALIVQSGAQLKTSVEEACAILNLLLLSISLKDEVGEHFNRAMRLLVEGACDRILA